jgi:hypothetical protein
LALNVSYTTFPALQKIGGCFAVPQSKEEIEQIEEQKVNEKSVVMKESKKVGVIYEQSKNPVKYTGVISGSYLYCYTHRKDLKYATYYYLKNVKIATAKEDNITKKPFAITIENAVNKLTLGFDQENSLNEWLSVIKDVS